MMLDAPAADQLAVEIHRPPRAGRWAAVRLALMSALALAFDGDDPGGGTVKHFLVVVDRETGAELLRQDTEGEDGLWEQHIQGQLDELTAGEFLDRWGLQPP